MSTYLEEYIDSIGSLPGELHKNFSLLLELDKQSQDLQRRIEDRARQHLHASMPGNEVHADMVGKALLDVEHEQKACIDIADKKVQLASSTYDLVDTHIRRLDKDLRKFEDELKQERELLRGSAAELKQAGQAASGLQDSEPGKGGRRKGTPSGGSSGALTPSSANVDLDLPVDPNEPTYCYCNQVSFGEMVACDNADCKIEWFHYECVGLDEQPKGKWYCPDCQPIVKKRKLGR